jgi:hypothetical protein
VSIRKWYGVLTAAPDVEPKKAFIATILLLGLGVALLGTIAYYLLTLMLLHRFIQLRNAEARQLSPQLVPFKPIALDLFYISVILLSPLLFSWVRTELLYIASDIEASFTPPVGADGVLHHRICNLVARGGLMFVSPFAVLYFTAFFWFRGVRLINLAGFTWRFVTVSAWFLLTGIWCGMAYTYLNEVAPYTGSFGMMLNFPIFSLFSGEPAKCIVSSYGGEFSFI